MVVVNHKTTKFESNSQQKKVRNATLRGCCQSQNYKIWKQFTTPIHIAPFLKLLLSITKLQNLKAIHNRNQQGACTSNVVVNHKTTKFESNSQHSRYSLDISFVVVNHKTTKFESNSQPQGDYLPR